ncbi:threonine/serine dehydratase [Halomonas sp. McH1-25]|uniref:threonine ammonia-lyase n=1 Tax=unclassified Halomonas TaxID=2609666 RepID=UPI001EF47715|nr:MULTISPECIES: threonine/serine dehydratase [unclassified Halomonas]MCG7599216.1 threonine/serine dehydratase [Halomonas sp. McH1-25]MCP1341084.1 threonine/serine dehydratase [Halomonas sp. FL8]MCP1361696.1 threonine/serine dehydratase [Halomonas sp. BBD45]MCP1364578.1 threonine/serine dehydratase [Halomonas sp. BBD48]
MLTIDDIRDARARIAGTLFATPILPEKELSSALAQRVLLKCELFQHTGSFKPRGGLNWICTANDAELHCGLGAVSAGNHALGLAWAAQTADIDVTIVMPEGASEFKVQGSRKLGAEVILHGDINEAWALMHRLVEERGLTLVHPYDDLRIIAGQGTVGLEILEQAPEAATIVCPVGGGGLVAGIAIAARALRPDIRVIGVEPEGAASMRAAWTHQGPYRLNSAETCAKSLGAAIVGEHTYTLCRQHVDALVTVSEAGIRQATRHLLTRTKLFAEPGAAVGLAALLENRLPVPLPDSDIVVVVTGGNMGLDELTTL